MCTSSIRMAAAIGAVLLGLSVRPAPGGLMTTAEPPPIDVPALLQNLTANGFDEREQATKTLSDALLNNRLTTDQISLIRQVALGRGAGALGALEPRLRAERIFKEFVLQQPTVKMLQLFVQAPITRVDEREMQYQFGGQRGQIMAGNFQGLQDFNKLHELASSAVNNLTAGDTEAAKTRLDELETFITGLSANRIMGLGFPGDRQDLLLVVHRALDKIPQAEMEILRTAGQPPGARLNIPIPGAGLVNAGGTFTMDIPIVITLGEVDITLPIEDALPALPPPGLQFVGYSAFVIPDEVIEVAGPITIGFQYGPELLFGNPVLDPSQLSLVRIANGAVQPLLDQFVNDPESFTISASYLPPSRGSGFNQFGFFAIVQPIPEPSMLILMGTGLVCLIWYEVWRRKMGSKSSLCSS